MMKSIFSYHVSGKGEHYHNKQGILRCTDQRFEPVSASFISVQGFSMADPIVRPGAANILVNPKNPRDAECMLEEITTLAKLHGFTEYYPSMHDECGACGGTTDLAFYEDVLKKSAAIIKRHIPHLIVKPIFFAFDGVYLIE